MSKSRCVSNSKAASLCRAISGRLPVTNDCTTSGRSATAAKARPAPGRARPRVDRLSLPAPATAINRSHMRRIVAVLASNPCDRNTSVVFHGSVRLAQDGNRSSVRPVTSNNAWAYQSWPTPLRSTRVRSMSQSTSERIRPRIRDSTHRGNGVDAAPSTTLSVVVAGAVPLNGVDDPGTQFSRIDDRVHRADADGPLHTVYPIELPGDLTEFLRPHCGTHLRELGVQLRSRRVIRSRESGLELGHTWIRAGTFVDITGEHHGRRGRPTDHGAE